MLTNVSVEKKCQKIMNKSGKQGRTFRKHNLFLKKDEEHFVSLKKSKNNAEGKSKTLRENLFVTREKCEQDKRKENRDDLCKEKKKAEPLRGTIPFLRKQQIEWEREK